MCRSRYEVQLSVSVVSVISSSMRYQYHSNWYLMCSSFPWPVILFVGVGLLVWLLKKNKTKQDWSFNYTFLYIDNIASLHNCLFGEYVDRIYPFQLGIKDITYTARSASFVDLHIEADRVRSCKKQTVYDKVDAFNFPIVNWPCIWKICVSVDTIFQSLWLLSWFPWQRVDVTKETTEPRVPGG